MRDGRKYVNRRLPIVPLVLLIISKKKISRKLKKIIMCKY